MKSRFIFCTLTILLIGSIAHGQDTSDTPEVMPPKGYSISPMIPAIKFQKRDRVSYEILKNVGATMNWRFKDSDNVGCFGFLGPTFSLVSDNWDCSMVLGLTWVDMKSKLGFGFGVSHVLFATQNGRDYGIATKTHLNDNLGVVLTFTRLPSQSSKNVSDNLVKEAQNTVQKINKRSQVVSKSDGAEVAELYYKAIKINPQNQKAREGLRELLKTADNPVLTFYYANKFYQRRDTLETLVFADIAKSQIDKLPNKEETSSSIKSINKQIIIFKENLSK